MTHAPEASSPPAASPDSMTTSVAATEDPEVVAVSAQSWALDSALAVLLVVLAWRLLTIRDLFAAVVLFIALGLVLALAWVRLQAPDIALAEVALGTGVTGALFINALWRLAHKGPPSDTARPPEATEP